MDSHAAPTVYMNLKVILFALLVALLLAVFVDTLTALAFAAFVTSMTQDLD